MIEISPALAIVANATGPAVLCVKYMQWLILEFSKLSERGLRILHMLHKNFMAESKIFHFVWEFASALRSISHCKLFEVI